MTATTAIRSTIAGVAMVWFCALPMATYGAAASPGPRWQVLAFAVYGLGSVICHQAAARSFVLLDTQLPVCARCTGVYLGAAAMSIVWSYRARLAQCGTSNGQPRLPSRLDARRLLALGLIPTAATLAYEWSTGVMTSNGIRALAGVALGLSITSVLLGMSAVVVMAPEFRAGSADRDGRLDRALRRG